MHVCVCACAKLIEALGDHNKCTAGKRRKNVIFKSLGPSANSKKVFLVSIVIFSFCQNQGWAKYGPVPICGL